MNVRQGYKVVSVFDSGIQKALGSAYLPPFVKGYTTYLQYLWTHRKEGCGPLAVFGKLEDAKEFIARNTKCLSDEVAIWRVDYVISRSKRLWYSRSAVRLNGELPTGTILANSVKLIEEVKL